MRVLNFVWSFLARIWLEPLDKHDRDRALPIFQILIQNVTVALDVGFRKVNISEW